MSKVDGASVAGRLSLLKRNLRVSFYNKNFFYSVNTIECFGISRMYV